MTSPQAEVYRVADDGALAIVCCAEPFMLSNGHPMRGAPCLICRQLIGAEAVRLIGMTVLAGDACLCGSTVTDMYLAHESHIPVDAELLKAAVARALTCPSCD